MEKILWSFREAQYSYLNCFVFFQDFRAQDDIWRHWDSDNRQQTFGLSGSQRDLNLGDTVMWHVV